MCHLHFSYEAYDKLQISVAELPADDFFKALKEEMKDFQSSYNTRHRGCSLSYWPVYVSVLSKDIRALGLCVLLTQSVLQS